MQPVLTDTLLLGNSQTVLNCSELPGRGIQAVIDSSLVFLGSPRKHHMTVAAVFAKSTMV